MIQLVKEASMMSKYANNSHIKWSFKKRKEIDLTPQNGIALISQHGQNEHFKKLTFYYGWNSIYVLKKNDHVILF